LVLEALRAAALRDAAERRRAAVRACRDSAFRDAAARPSRFNARLVARDRLADVFRRGCFPARAAAAALCFVRALPVVGADSFTPARLAFDRPIAIACFVDLAPCFPSRM
jgi:hypothetical protein